jgi:hypothetical protein
MSDPTSAPAKRRRIDLTLLRVLLPKSAAQVLHLDLLHRTWAPNQTTHGMCRGCMPYELEFLQG